MRTRAQVLVELALALPLILLILIGSVEAGFLLIAKAHQDRTTGVVVNWAAAHPSESWDAVAERSLPGCSVTMTSPLPDLLEASVTCHYSPKVLVMWAGLPMSSRESSAMSPPASPAPTPAPSPSSSFTGRAGGLLAWTSATSPSTPSSEPAATTRPSSRPTSAVLS